MRLFSSCANPNGLSPSESALPDLRPANSFCTRPASDFAPALMSLLMAVLLAACATPGERGQPERSARITMADLAEPVDRVYLPRLDHWRPLDRRHLLLYSSPARQYLVRLDRPVTDPIFHELAIGVGRSSSYLHSKFDYVIIDGWRYYIDEIRPLTREQARALS